MFSFDIESNEIMSSLIPAHFPNDILDIEKSPRFGMSQSRGALTSSHLSLPSFPSIV